MQAVGDGAQGWCNAILYVFLSPTIRKRLILNPCNSFIDKAVEKARGLLETDTQNTERSSLLSATTSGEYGSARSGGNNSSDGRCNGGASKNSNSGSRLSSSETSYHSISTDKVSEDAEVLIHKR